MTKRVDHFAEQRKLELATGQVSTWTDERLLAQTAAGQLVASWGLASIDAQRVIMAQRSRRGLK